MDRIPSSLPQNIIDQNDGENDATAATTNARSSSIGSIRRGTFVHPLMGTAMMMSTDPKGEEQEEPGNDGDNDDGGDGGNDQGDGRRSYSYHEKEPSAKRQRTSTGASASRNTATAPGTVATSSATATTTTTEGHDADNNEVNTLLVHQEQWNEMLERLAAYKARHGHCLVPKRYAEDPRLGTWVETQRVQYKRLVRIFDEQYQQEIPQPNKRLTAERLSKLYKLGFCWSAKQVRKMTSLTTTTIPATAAAATTTTTHMTTDTNTANVVVLRSEGGGNLSISHQQQEQHHHLLPPSLDSNHLPTYDTPNTSTTHQGQHFIGMYHHHHPMSHFAVATSSAAAPPLLTALPGPGGTTSTGTNTIHASSTAPPSATKGPIIIAAAVAAAAGAIGGGGGHVVMAEEDAIWEDFYHRLVQFREWHGHTLVPRKYEADPKLSTWVEQQRAAWNRDYNTNKTSTATTQPAPTMINEGSINQNQTDYPSAASFVVGEDEAHHSPADEDEDAMWNVVADMDNTHPILHSPTITAATTTATGQISPTGGVLVPYKNLSLERKQKLDAVGFVWSLRSKRIGDHWDDMFRQLVEYKDRHGDCLVPSRYEANLKLGKWVETQRYEYTKLQRATSDNDEPIITPITTALLSTNAANINNSNRPANPRLTPERLSRLESIGFEWKVKNKMKRYYDKQWDVMFQTLLDFKKKYGHCNVPKRFPENARLGTWVHTQRIQYRRLVNGNNSKGTVSNMNSPLPPGTEASPGDQPPSPRSELDEMMMIAMDSATQQAAMVDNPNANGAEPSAIDDTLATDEANGNVPAFLAEVGFLDDKSSGVSNWTVEQFQSFRLTDARLKRLEEVGFCWSARDGNDKSTLLEVPIARNSYDDQWDVMFALLEKYKQATGDCLVPKRYPANQKLGTWVDTQRVQYKKMLKKVAEMQQEKQGGDNTSVGSASGTTPLVGRLTQDRIQRLQNLGFVWSLRDDWAKHYEELKAYKSLHGHCNVPARYTENRRLGIWVSAQRQHYKMLQNHEQQLDQMEESERASSPDGADATAKGRRPAPVTQERVDLLNALGFTWTIRSRDTLGESWNQRFQELRQFKEQHGHCLVPSRYDKNTELGIWVGTQRSQYRLYMRARETGQGISTNMNDDRIRELEDLGFVWALRGSLPEDAIAVAVEIADQVAVAAGGGGPPHHRHPLHHHHHHNHHGVDPMLVGHHVEPTILDYHPYPVTTHHHHNIPPRVHHNPAMEMHDSVNADAAGDNKSSGL